MNILELHDRIRFWIDETSSPRFDDIDIDQAINIAIDNIVKEYYDRDSLNNPSKSIQVTQKVRDTLMSLEKKKRLSSTDITLGEIRLDKFPLDYGILLGLYVTTSDEVTFQLKATDYNNQSKIHRNPYMKVKSGGFIKGYYNELNTGIGLILHEDTDIDKIEMYYLARPPKVFIGNEISVLVANDQNRSVIVFSSSLTYDTTVYNYGDVVLIDDHTKTFTGKALIGYTNPVLPSIIHEDIAVRSAANLLESVSMAEKANLLIQRTIEK